MSNRDNKPNVRASRYDMEHDGNHRYSLNFLNLSKQQYTEILNAILQERSDSVSLGELSELIWDEEGNVILEAKELFPSAFKGYVPEAN